jgi:hypothetical protein
VNAVELSGSFTAEQLKAVALPADARTLVEAAAGTGKTHTLAGRLTWLTECQGLSAGDQVLVLSFSRAAVGELRRRVAGLDGDARYVAAATFDSFATRILAAAEPDPDRIARMDYDTRIHAAVELLSGQAALDELQLVQHVLVDEVQDVVGARADLVMALLELNGAGFTLFGDPAQAIYDYQEDRPAGVPDLFSRVQRRYSGKLISLELTHDHRSATPLAKRVASAGARLRLPEPDRQGVTHDLRSIFLSLPTVKVAAARRMVCRGDGDVSAFLTRTNGDALLLSRALFDAGTAHRYQRRGEEKVAPAWIAKLVAGLAENQVTRAALDERLKEVAVTTPADPDDLYSCLRGLSPGRGRTVDLLRVADRVREQNLPEDLNAVPTASVVVSTIYRAKGLEFDRVLLTGVQESQVGDSVQEDRVMYVALTRARREIFHVTRPDTAGLSIDRGTKRWVRRGFGQRRWKVREIEVTGQDAHAVHPAGTWLLKGQPVEVQEYLGSEVHAGDPVELQLIEGRMDDNSSVHYGICHQGHVVGLTSEGFGRSLGQVLGGRPHISWPQRIEGLHVELVDTVAGDVSVGRAHGLGNSGMWLRARVFGLGSLRFASGEEADGA